MVLSIASEVDKSLTVQDRLRIKLNEFGAKHISTTIEELATSLKLPSNSVYQALHRLRQYGEIDLEKTEQNNGREKIVGIIVNKLEPSNRTYKRAAERSFNRVKPALETIDNIETVDGIPMLPETTDYLNKKLAIEEMKQRAIEAGLDPAGISFEPNTMGEEAIILLKLYTELRKAYLALKGEHRQVLFDLEAERRNVEYYKNKVQEETKKELLAHARSN